MSRIIVVANMTSLRVFEIATEINPADKDLLPSLLEITGKQSGICSSWTLEKYITELARMVNTIILDSDADSWVFAIPFSLTPQVLPLLSPAVKEKLGQIVMQDIVSRSIDEIAQIITPPSSCDRFGHQTSIDQKD